MKRQLPIILLLSCVALVSFWQIMAWRARRGFDAFQITAESLADFHPQVEGWTLTSIPVSDDPLEPNIIAFKATPRSASAQPVLIRLAHGYNMPDCMRIKHYEVAAFPSGEAAIRSIREIRGHSFPCQAWQLTSPINDESIWITSMHNSSDFAPLDMDVRSMAFPRIGTPDDPGWQPSGLRLKSLRRPLYNLKRTLRSRWNSSRCDLLIFLRLRRPAYLSNEMLTLVSTVVIPPANNDDPVRIETEQHNRQQHVHAGIVRELMTYRGLSRADDAD